jgi:hypothetical protein
MKRTTKYAALDVHQTTTLASVRGESGGVMARATLPTEERAIVEFFRGMRGRVHVTFEGRDAGAVAPRSAGSAGGSGRGVRPAQEVAAGK